MTTIYFIRHAEPDYSNRDGRNRPLTEKGMSDRALVTAFLQDKNINVMFSSPFKRAVDTLADYAGKNNFQIELIEDFREHELSGIDDWVPFAEKQWADFSYKLSETKIESLFEVQTRNVNALNDVLVRYKDKNIVIGTHSMALSTIINYYDRTYGFNEVMSIVGIMPWVVRVDFNDDGCVGMAKTNLFNPEQKDNYDKCVVRTADLGALKAYKYTVIFARYKDKWLYCRAKERDAFETAGGHIEQGESPLEGAKRELFEETGAVSFDISPTFDYTVHVQTGYANGQVFFALIHELGDVPDFEMAEVGLFDATPDKMRFPKILPVLYEKMQMWLNLQSAKDEIWDIYDSKRNLSGRTHQRA